jgi:hypothetical protein
MIEHVWTVVCSRAVIDIDSHNVSIENALEQINLPEWPMSEAQVESPEEEQPAVLLPLNYEIISLWVRSRRDEGCSGQVRLRLISPTGEAMEMAEMSVDLRQAQRVRLRVKCEGFRVTSPGRYIFRVEQRNEKSSKWQQAGRALLDVVVASQ